MWASSRPPQWPANDGHSGLQLQRGPLVSGLFVPEVERLCVRISSAPLKDEVSYLAPLKHDQNPNSATRDTPRDLSLSCKNEALTISTEVNLLLPVVTDANPDFR